MEGSHTHTLASKTCITSAYTTVTGCSVIKSVTTVTTTRTSSTREGHPTCGPELCGSNACLAKKQNLTQLPPRDIERRGNPDEGLWPDPEEYPQGYIDFMPAQILDIRSPRNAGPDDYSPKLVRNVPIDAPEEEQYAVTHNWITFKHKVEALAVEGLAGCLSIVIISSRGAWASHFYENTLADEELFDEAMEEWRSGRDEDDPMFEFAPYGLDQLKNNPDLGDLGIMFGDDRDPDENLDVLAFVIAPRPRPSYWDANGNLIPDALLQHPAINLNTFAYPQRNRRIATELLSIFGRGRINMLLPNYAPITLIYSEWDAWRKGYVPSDEYNSLLKDTECKSHRGKVLIQYQPAKTCSDVARWRLFVDNFGLYSERSWPARSDQVFRPPTTAEPEEQAPVRRQACPRPIKNETVSANPKKPASPQSSPSVGHESLAATNIQVGAGSGTKVLPTTFLFPNGTMNPNTSTNMTTGTATSAGSGAPLLPTTLLTPNRTMKPTLSTMMTTDMTTKVTTMTSSIGNSSTTALSSSSLFSSSSLTSPTTVPIFTTIWLDPRPTVTLEPIEIITAIPNPHDTISWKKTTLPDLPSTTSEPAPPPMTSTKAPPPLPPQPSVAVNIYYKETIGAGMEAIGMGEMWVMFPTKLDRVLNLCEADMVGWKPTFFNTRTWPPSFSAKKDIHGRQDCKYIGNGDGEKTFGRFTCKGVPEFDCIKDRQFGQAIDCEKELDQITFKPRVRCLFPAN